MNDWPLTLLRRGRSLRETTPPIDAWLAAEETNMIPCTARHIIVERTMSFSRTLPARVLNRQRRRPRCGSSCCVPVAGRTFSDRSSSGTVSPVLTHHWSQGQDDDDVVQRPHVNTTTATELVDSMLKSTLQLLQQEEGGQRTTMNVAHVVAFSGGVDSTLATALLQRVLGTTPSFSDSVSDRPAPAPSLLAVLGVSAAVSQEQLDLARRIADELQVDFRTVPTREGSDPTYLANAGQACRACKTHLYSTLESIHQRSSTLLESNSQSAATSASPNSSSTGVQLYNGTNADDFQDATRVGLLAAQQFKVLSPLQYYTKRQVREAAKHLGLSNWNAAASPCLRSRLALGVHATQKHLQTIERAERHVRTVLQQYLSDESNVRVRMLSNNEARIELDHFTVDEAKRVNWLPEFMAMGFDSVSVRPFRSGSVAGPQVSSETDRPSDIGDRSSLNASNYS